MFMNTSLAAGIVALSALAAAVPAQADSLSFGIQASGGDVGFYTQVHSPSYGDRNYGDRRWNGRQGRNTHLRPVQVRRILRDRGFRDMQFVDRTAPVYKLRATGPRGRRVFLVVSSRTGQIIERRPLRSRSHDRRYY